MFSIVTINYNNYNGLKNTFESMKSQSISKELYEFIVIDGDSTDGSKDLISDNSEYIDKVIIEKDNGIFDAMNKGISLADKKYIFFLNSGDQFDNPNVLTDMYAIITSNPNRNLYKGRVNTFIDGTFLREAELCPWVCHQAVFLKTELSKKYLFDTNLKIFGDLDLWYRLKSDGLYSIFETNILICNMEMDGVGNSPLFIKKRIQDKITFNNKHNLSTRLYIDRIIQYTSYIFFRLFGKKAYHKYYIGTLIYVRKKIHSNI